MTELVLAAAVLTPEESVDGYSGQPETPSTERGRRRSGLLMLAGALVGATVAAGAAMALAGAGGRSLPTVELTAFHSRFTPARIAVERGTTVRFVVRNDDPIAHELIVGPAEVHERHEKGTESYHPPTPGEVTVEAGEVAETTYTFDTPGVVAFGCHLPGHWSYGMHGEVEVR